ncbi:hypothetical protein MNBD_GAMMA05-2580 [hydrothermal vent metagenome]|uniref:Fe2OG dioxygenase domain-containing protein n=1 Tax=hydrothermal vent metagenome TaxID=652676 RepID=A0A3B0WH70_9ZZZZ
MLIYQKITSKISNKLNSAIKTGFHQHQNDLGVRKTHLFEDRYENIYLNEKHISELSTLINEATQHAQKILKVDGLRAGYWFNYMPPESTTTLHTHDDDDELLSAVYYVDVPEDSGNLIIYQDSKKIEIKPETGDFIFFKPDVRHEVSRNNSHEHRLSIGINFGVHK